MSTVQTVKGSVENISIESLDEEELKNNASPKINIPLENNEKRIRINENCKHLMTEVYLTKKASPKLSPKLSPKDK